MKYPAELYAKAFVEVISKAPEKEHKSIFKRFVLMLEKYGDINNLEKISREMRKLLVKKNGGRFVEVELAHENKKLEEKISGAFAKKDYIEVSIKEDLIAGARILVDQEKELDFSFQQRLRNLFS